MTPAFKKRVTDAHTARRDSVRFLRHARRLYCALVWRMCVADTTNETIDRCAMKLVKSGLYSEKPCMVTALRHARYAILRRGWFLSTLPHQRRWGANDWHHWCKRYGFESWHWHRPADLRAIA